MNSDIPLLQAVVDSQVSLSCNISLPSEDDSISLVLWYKSGISAPIFSVDARYGPLENSKHFTSEYLGSRGYLDFNFEFDLAFLIIKPVKDGDEGDYYCRVDFRWGRTVKSVVKIDVIVPPRSVLITNEKNELLYGTIGPYDEGFSLILRCIAKGGRPLPTVTWWRDSVEIDNSFQKMNEQDVRNDYIIRELSRKNLMAEITCQASNTNLTSPEASAVIIDMNLKPVDVHIISTRRHFCADRQFGVECQTRGSRPPANITWWLGTQKLSTAVEIVKDGGNRTVSNLVFIPTSEDNGKYLFCRAENRKMPGISKTDGLTLNVHYAPILFIYLNTTQNPDKLYEGNNIYFECKFQSNPKIVKLEWQYQGSTLLTNPRTGIYVRNKSLVLQNVSRAQSGTYRCLAVNLEGRGESEGLEIKIKYAPVCKENQKTIYTVTLEELVEIYCEVEADPSDVTFTWAVNNTGYSREVLSFDSFGFKSVARYIPHDESDFGFVACKARNVIGVQKEACIFTLLYVQPPERVHNCSISNYSTDSLLLVCYPGDDGGLEQTFHLEAYLSGTKELQANISNSVEPVFRLSGLIPGASFVLFVHSFNEKGKSSSVALTAQTQIPARWHKGSHRHDAKPHLGIFVGAVTALALLVIIIVLLVRMRGVREEGDNGDASEATIENKYGAVSEGVVTNNNLDSSDPDLILLRNFMANFQRTNTLKKKETPIRKCTFSSASRSLYYEKQRNCDDYSNTSSPETHSLKNNRCFDKDNGGFSDEELLFQSIPRPRSAGFQYPRVDPWTDDDGGRKAESTDEQRPENPIKIHTNRCYKGQFYGEQQPLSKTMPSRRRIDSLRVQHRKHERDTDRLQAPVPDQRSLKSLYPEMQTNSCPHSNYGMSTPV
ncbi:protein turtle-like isoform X2 [Tachypleus tridentatus]|uniref:protein turtle-like isoform X2 n=1 Tax=Tachypleus tridentatus TaxID=6853 RepID=UPI003FD37C92